MVSCRSGPHDTIETGTPVSRQKKTTYCRKPGGSTVELFIAIQSAWESGLHLRSVVPRHHEVGDVADEQVARVESGGLDLLGFLEQPVGIHEHAVGDDLDDVRMEDGGRDKPHADPRAMRSTRARKGNPSWGEHPIASGWHLMTMIM